MADQEQTASAAAQPTAADTPAAENTGAGAAAAGASEADAPKLTHEEIQAQVEARMKELEEMQMKKPGERVIKPLTGAALGARTTEEAKAAEKPAPVKVATSDANTEVEGSMSAEEKVRMQAMLGAAKSKDTKVFANLKDREIVVAPAELDPRATVVIANCHNCSVVLDSLCTKVFVQGCNDLKLECKGKIVTHTVEVFRSDNFTGVFHVKIGTLQLDMCKGLDLTFTKAQHFGNIIWAGCWNISTTLVDTGDELKTGFGAMKEKFHDIHEERTQFKVSVVNKKLMNEKVVRLANGFPTTKREMDAFEERQEHNMKLLAKEYGVVVPNKKRAEPKVGRNDTCTCGSGRKYKKCCGMGV